MTEKSIQFELTSLPVLAGCDVVVVGASFGGIAAALELAKAGRTVTLVEPRTYPGREITSTLRPWLDATENASALISSVIEVAGRGAAQAVALNMDALKIHLEDLLLQAGVKLLYASVVVGIQQDAGVLQGVIIGNKSGRQLIQCSLVIDTSETALVARLLSEAFEPVPSKPIEYRRTLEYDGVRADFALDQPLVVGERQAKVYAGYRDKGHVLVECSLELPFTNDNAFDLSQREIIARQQTLDFASELAHHNPAFATAYLSGASYELYGMHSPRLLNSERAWTAQLSDVRLKLESLETLQLADFAGVVQGVWYLNEAVPLEQFAAENFYNPAFISRIGEALGRCLSKEWKSASQQAHLTPKLEVEPNKTATIRVREQSSPQKGKPFQRIPVNTLPLPTLRDVDVLVVGGGSSGATAAITSAREGVRTVLVEMNPGLGGTGTFGGVHSYWFGRRIGFSEKVMEIVDNMHIYLSHPQPKGIIPKWNIEAKSYALLKEAYECGAEILFNAFVIGTVVDGNRVCGVAVATRMGIGIIRARVVIDASGDGDVAAFAGAEYVYGNDRDHATMWYALAQFPRPGLTRNHFTSTVDVSNIEDYTRAILAGRRRGSKEEMHDHGIYVAPRESRHIKADVVLTLTDQLRQRRWEDVINVAFSNHDVKGQSGSDWLRIGLIPPNLEIEIPYRALLPQHLDGILVVGKAISATHDALPAIRMQADLENLGGVAAVAAAQAVRSDQSLRGIHLKEFQQRLVQEAVLPPEVLTRTLHTKIYSDDELRQMINALPVFPLYQYSDMELTDLFEGVIPLVEICCAGERVIPLLEEAHATAEGERKVLLAQMLALVGSVEGVSTLIDSIERHLQEDRPPARKAHIRYTQLPPDHGAMPEVVYLLYSLGMVPDSQAFPIWQRVVELLAAVSEEDFYEEMKGVFYYVDAVCYSAERGGKRAMIPLLERLYSYAPFHGKTAYEGFQSDYIQERLAYLELVIGRALARCGSVEGFIILTSYLNDSRALLAEHAHTELVSITGEDHGKDVREWSRWLEFNGENMPSKPWQPPTEPMQTWNVEILTK